MGTLPIYSRRRVAVAFPECNARTSPVLPRLVQLKRLQLLALLKSLDFHPKGESSRYAICHCLQAVGVKPHIPSFHIMHMRIAGALSLSYTLLLGLGIAPSILMGGVKIVTLPLA